MDALGKKAQALKAGGFAPALAAALEVLDNQLADFGWGIKKLLEDIHILLV